MGYAQSCQWGELDEVLIKQLHSSRKKRLLAPRQEINYLIECDKLTTKPMFGEYVNIQQF